MSEIKALEEMRKCYSPSDSSAIRNKMLAFADAIQAEVDGRFMELPVDADGVPIHVGDEIECHANGYDGTFTVFAISNNVAVGNHDIEWIRRNPDKWFHVASFCTHVKQRTLEDVLNDCADEISEKRGIAPELNRDTPTRNEIVDKYAAEIREMLGQ